MSTFSELSERKKAELNLIAKTTLEATFVAALEAARHRNPKPKSGSEEEIRKPLQSVIRDAKEERRKASDELIALVEREARVSPS